MINLSENKGRKNKKQGFNIFLTSQMGKMHHQDNRETLTK